MGRRRRFQTLTPGEMNWAPRLDCPWWKWLKWWKKPRAATQFWWVLMFSRISICATCNLIPLTFFILCLSDISYQERRQLYQFVQLYQRRGRQERVTYHANYAANMDKIAKLQRVKSLAQRDTLGYPGIPWAHGGSVLWCFLPTKNILKKPYKKHARGCELSAFFLRWMTLKMGCVTLVYGKYCNSETWQNMLRVPPLFHKAWCFSEPVISHWHQFTEAG